MHIFHNNLILNINVLLNILKIGVTYLILFIENNNYNLVI